MSRAADFVIVGGGVYGAATAWELADRGAEVLLLEKNQLAAGASGGVGKRGVRANGRDMRELPLMRGAHRLWPELADRLNAETGYERTGQLTLYERHHDVGAADARAQVQNHLGVETLHLSFEAARDIEPGLAPVVMGALYCPADGVADHTATTKAYGAAAQGRGVAVVEGARVASIESRGGRAVSVRLGTDEVVEVRRELLLLANTANAELLAPFLSAPLPVWTVYPQVVRSTPAVTSPVRGLIGHMHRPVAIKMMADSRVMLSGGWRGVATEQVGSTLPQYVDGNWAEALRLFPEMSELDVQDSVADRPESICFDGIPVIDRVPGIDNAIMAWGWTGHGWAMAPAVAPLLAEWALRGDPDPLLLPFAAGRFDLGSGQ